MLRDRRALYVAVLSTCLIFLFTLRQSASPTIPYLSSLLPSARQRTVSPAQSQRFYAESEHLIPGPLPPLGSETLEHVLHLADQVVNASKPVQCFQTPAHLKRYREFFDRHPINFIIGMSLSNNANVLPTVIRELPKLVEFLGADRVHASFTEGGSKDETIHLIELAGRAVRAVGGSFTMRVEGTSVTRAGDMEIKRFDVLAKARNDNTIPLDDGTAELFGGFDYMVFVNDVVYCMVDVLELMMQAVLQNTDIMCGSDYNSHFFQVVEPHFYDIWVARDRNGLCAMAFWKRQQDWTRTDILSRDPDSQRRFHANLPFQVSICWNGILAVRTMPLLPPYDIRLRSPGNLIFCEATILCVDFSMAGFSRIAMAPRVKVAYEPEIYEAVRQDTNTTALDVESFISWIPAPPREAEFFDNTDFHQLVRTATIPCLNHYSADAHAQKVRRYDWYPGDPDPYETGEKTVEYV